MKAALNGVPSFGVLDGWWIEGHEEGITGWAIGPNHRAETDSDERESDAAVLYEKLEGTVLPLYYQEPERYHELMVQCIARNGARFNAHRMMREYIEEAYR